MKNIKVVYVGSNNHSKILNNVTDINLSKTSDKTGYKLILQKRNEVIELSDDKVIKLTDETNKLRIINNLEELYDKLVNIIENNPKVNLCIFDTENSVIIKSEVL